MTEECYRTIHQNKRIIIEFHEERLRVQQHTVYERSHRVNLNLGNKSKSVGFHSFKIHERRHCLQINKHE